MEPVKLPPASASQFAEILAVDNATVTRWLDEGMPHQAAGKRGQRGQRVAVRIELRAGLRWVLDRRSRRISNRDRLADEQADKIGLENARKRGELLRTVDVAEIFQTLAADLVAGHESVPGRVAGELAGMTDPGTIRDRLRDELRAIRRAFVAAADRVAELVGRHSDNDSDPDAAAQADVKRVGRRKSNSAARERGAGTVAEL